MARRFLIEQLRSIVARALQTGDYEPTESARVRAVPDTRTIRYYTTLGLIGPPAEMRGRIAYYDEMHVLQLVAIKQLQAQSKTLSDIQNQLVGLPSKKLEVIAKLPSDFWKAVDDYLVTGDHPEPSRQSSRSNLEQVSESSADSAPYWLTPAALPEQQTSASQPEENAKAFCNERNASSPALTVGTMKRSLNVRLTGGIDVSIQIPMDGQWSGQVDWEAIAISLKPLIKELRKQKLARSE